MGRHEGGLWWAVLGRRETNPFKGAGSDAETG